MPLALLLLSLLAAASAAAALAPAYVDRGPDAAWTMPGAGGGAAGGVHGPQWPWQGGNDGGSGHAREQQPAPQPLQLPLLPEAEARRISYVTATFKVTGPNTVTATFSNPIYAHRSDYSGLRVYNSPDDHGSSVSRAVTGLSGPFQTSGYFGIITTPSRTHTLSFGGPPAPTSATGRINVAQLHYFNPGNIFEGNSVHYYYVRHSNVFVADGQAPSLVASGGGAPSLDLERAVLGLELNERTDVSRIALRGITLSCDPRGGGAALGLGNMSGAALPAADAARAEIALSPGQKSRLLSSYALCDPGAWRASIASSTLFDMGGNALPPRPGVPISVSADTRQPELSGSPSIDLSSGVVEVRFTEYVAAGAGALGMIAVEDGAGGQPSTLAGASLAVSGDAATITLTEAQRIKLVREHAGSGRLLLDVAARAFQDLAGHDLGGAREDVPLDVAPDASPPGLLAGTRPSLDLDAGRLAFAFNETVDLREANMTGARILGAGSAVLAVLDGLMPRAAGDSRSAEFGLNRTLRADSIGAARITVPAGAFADAARNPFPGLSAFPLNVTADSTRPSLAPGSEPRLDLNNGTLTARFDEYMGKVRPWGIVLRDADRARDTVLGGAAVLQPPPPPGGPKYTETVVVNLTRQQAAAAALSNASLIEASPSVFEDLSGNPFTGLVAADLDVVPDTTPPALDAARRPVLNTASSTLAVFFTEYVNASAVNTTGISVETASGAAILANLTGATGPAADGDAAVVGLTGAQASALSSALSSPSARPLRIDIDAGSFADVSGNEIGGVLDREIAVVGESTRPGLHPTLNPSLDLGTLRLLIHFNKTVNAPAMDLSGIAVEGPGGANRTYLTGATPPSATGSMAEVWITEDQKASIIVARAAGGPLRINMSSSAVSDLSGNALAGTARALNIVPDGDEPGLDASMRPVLDLAAGSLTVWLDEHINSSLTTPSKIELVNDTNTGLVDLDGARVRLPPPGSPPQYSATILLTPDQKRDAIVDNSSRITSSGRGAFSDLTGNGIERLLGRNPFAPNQDDPTTWPLRFALRVVEDTAAPRLLAGMQPVLNLTDGTLTLRFDEHVVPAAAQPRLVELVGGASPPPPPPPGSPRIALGSSDVSAPADPVPGRPPPGSSDTAIVWLAPAEKAAAVAAVAAGGAVVLGSGAFSDLSGNPSAAQSAVLSVVPDGAAPGIDGAAAPPVLDLGAGILTVRFDEHVNASAANMSRVSLSAAAAPGAPAAAACASGIGLAGASASAGGGGSRAAAPPGASTELAVSLTAAQKAAAAACGTAMEMAAQPGAFRDLSGNADGAYAVGVRTLADADAPRLDTSAPPSLDMDAGILTVRFDEYVNASAADLSRVSLSAAGIGGMCASGIGLAGASAAADAGAAADSPPAPPGTSPGAAILLTEAQRAAAAACWTAPGAAALEVAALQGAFPDVSWNPSAPFGGARVSVAPDTTPPGLAAAPPPPPVLLNPAAGTLSLTFSEHVRASSAEPSRVAVTDAANGSATVLSGAAVRGGPDGATLVIDLAPSRVTSILAANSSSGGPVLANIGAGAVRDMSGNPSVRAPGQAVSFSSDAAPPRLDGSRPPSLDLNSGELAVWFGEPVDASSLDASGISIEADPAPAEAPPPARLGGAAVVPALGGNLSAVGLVLSPAQKAASMAAADAASAAGGRAVLRISPGSVADLALNAIGAEAAALSVVPDTSPPLLSAARPPRLDLGDGVLVLRFDEYVSASSANSSRIWLLARGSDSPADPGAVRLAGAAAFTDDPDSDAVRVQLTPDLKAAAAGAHRVWLAAGALDDLSGNPAAQASAVLSVARDVAAPRLDDSALPLLNLSSGVLAAAFDEHIDAQSANLSRLLVVDASGSRTVPLGGASLSPGGGASVAIRLTPAQRVAASEADSASGPARLAAREAGALRDLSGNPLAAFGPSPMTVVPDSAGPVAGGAAAAAAGRQPSLDLRTGILEIPFDELVDVGATNLADVRLVTNASALIAGLGGYEAAVPAGGDSTRVVVKLDPPDLGAVVVASLDSYCGSDHRTGDARRVQVDVGRTVRLEAGAGAFYDTLGNPSPPMDAANLSIAADMSHPSFEAPPLLNPANRSIVLAFDGPVFQWVEESTPLLTPSRVMLGAHISFPSIAPGIGSGRIFDLSEATVSDIGSGRVRVNFSQALSGDQEAAADGGGAYLILPRGAFRNLSCGVLDAQNAAMAVTPDNVPPEMLAGYPKLNLSSAVMTMMFNEDVDIAGMNASAVSLSWAGGQAIRFGAGAASAGAAAAAGDTVLLQLTPRQKYDAVVAYRSAPPLLATITGAAVSDLSYLYYAGLDGYALEVTADTAPPRILDGAGDAQRRPTLGIEAGELTIHFDEYVNATSARPERASLAAGPGQAPGGRLGLAPGSPVAPAPAPGSPPAAEAGQALAVSLGPADVLAAIAGSVTHLRALAGAFSDVSEIASVGEGPIRMLVVHDTTPPRLDGRQRLNLGTGMLGLNFSEPVNASAAHMSGIVLSPPAPARQGEERTVALARSAVAPDGRPGGALNSSVTVSLSPPDKAAAAAVAAELLSLTAGSFVDASHNRVNGTDDVPLDVIPDTVKPRLDPGRQPVLDLDAGTVVMHLDEYVNATTARPMLAELAGAGGSPRFGLSGAPSAGPWSPPLPPGAAQDHPLSPLQRDVGIVGSPAFEVALAQRQRAAAVGLAGPVLHVPANAFEDLSGNRNDPDSRALGVRPDATGPGINSSRLPVLSLGSGALEVWLDEYVDADATNASGITIAWGPGERERIRLAGGAASAGPDAGGPPAGALPPLPAGASLSVSIVLTADQKAAAVALERSAGGGGAARLIAEPGAFEDLSGNPSGAAGAPLRVAADNAPPRLADGKRPLLNLEARTLTTAIAIERLSPFALVLPVAAFVWLWRERGRPTFARSALLVTFALGLFATTLLQKRFFNSASVGVALLLGLAFGELWRLAAGSAWRRALLVGALVLVVLPTTRPYGRHLSNEWAVWQGGSVAVTGAYGLQRRRPRDRELAAARDAADERLARDRRDAGVRGARALAARSRDRVRGASPDVRRQLR